MMPQLQCLPSCMAFMTALFILNMMPGKFEFSDLNFYMKKRIVLLQNIYMLRVILFTYR